MIRYGETDIDVKCCADPLRLFRCILLYLFSAKWQRAEATYMPVKSVQ